jgi:hypothetical protein
MVESDFPLRYSVVCALAFNSQFWRSIGGDSANYQDQFVSRGKAQMVLGVRRPKLSRHSDDDQPSTERPISTDVIL